MHMSCKYCRSALDIGSWQTIFLIISVIAVVTNAGLTTYTMTTLDGFSMEFKFWVFILFQWICFMLQVKQLLLY